MTHGLSPGSTPPISNKTSYQNVETPLNKDDRIARIRLIAAICAFQMNRSSSVRFKKPQVCFVTSGVLENKEKIKFEKTCMLLGNTSYPELETVMCWVDIEKDVFFEAENFQKVVRRIYALPPRSKIFLDIGGRFV